MHRHVLDGVEGQAGGARLLDQRADVRLLPALLAGQFGRVHLDAVRADLEREAQLLVGQLVELADRDPQWHAGRSSRGQAGTMEASNSATSAARSSSVRAESGGRTRRKPGSPETCAVRALIAGMIGRVDDPVDEVDHSAAVRPAVDDVAERAGQEIRHAADRAPRAVRHRAGKLAFVADEDLEIAVRGEEAPGGVRVAGTVLDAGDGAGPGRAQPRDQVDRDRHGGLAGDVVEDDVAQRRADAVEDGGVPGEESVRVDALEKEGRGQKQARGSVLVGGARGFRRRGDAAAHHAGVDRHALRQGGGDGAHRVPAFGNGEAEAFAGGAEEGDAVAAAVDDGARVAGHPGQVDPARRVERRHEGRMQPEFRCVRQAAASLRFLRQGRMRKAARVNLGARGRHGSD